MLKTGLMVLAAAALATSASAATTAPNQNPFAKSKVMLNLTGLDLSTADGQQRLAIRMDNAARAVCGDRLSTVSLVMAQQARECRTAVKANIRSQIETRMADASASKTANSEVAFNR